MTGALYLLRATKPDWFQVRRSDGRRIHGLAMHGPWSELGLDLTIHAGNPPSVGETKPGTQLPAFCPERHIQGDQTFCVGLNRPAVSRPKHAIRWWFDLDRYLACQAIAGETGLWPPKHNLDHGDAGAWHALALDLADALGLTDEYEAARLGQPSWITSTGLARIGFPRPPEEPVLQKPRVGNDPRCQADLLRLVGVERRRRKVLAAFWAKVEAGDQMCCGSGMRDCRFPKAP